MKKYLTRKIAITLLLILTVSLLLFVSLIFPTTGHKPLDNPKFHTKIELALFYRGILDYKKDIGRYPSSGEGLTVLMKNVNGDLNWTGPYVKHPFADEYIDSWNEPYIYQYPNICDVKSDTFLLYSVGKNKIDECGNGDDIVAKYKVKY